jgi:hypothetical protein
VTAFVITHFTQLRDGTTQALGDAAGAGGG